MRNAQEIHSRKRVTPGRFRWARLFIFLGVLIILGALTASFSFAAARQIVVSWEMTRLGGIAIHQSTPRPDGQATLPPGKTTDSPSLILPEPDPWDGASRVTVLVMGLDYRDWEKGEGPPRTDTMILLTIDPLTKTAGILSLQRDLWVTISGMEGYQKINTAYRFGELYKLPGGGPALAMKTVEGLVGVPIDFYAQVDFSAFEKFIDEIGGIEIDVPEEIKVDPIGPGNTVVLKPGRQTLDGPTALGYARNRYTKYDDFDRAARQQQVIFAIRDRILKLNMLPLLVYKAPALYKALGAGVHTDMTLQQAIQLAWLAQSIPEVNITRKMIGPNEVIGATSPDGQSILKPIPSRIRMLRDEIFTTTLKPAAAEMAPQERIRAEGARILVINSTGNPGLAGRTADYLESQGMQISESTPGKEILTVSRILDYTGKPYTLRILVDLLKIQPNQVRWEYKPDSKVDFAITLGKDALKSVP